MGAGNVFKQFFKRMQSEKEPSLREKFVQETQRLHEINEWSAVTYLISRLNGNMPEEPSEESYEATYAFEKNNMKYEIETVWHKGDCQLFLYGYIENVKSIIATLNKVFDHKESSIVFNLPLQRKGEEKIKEIMVELKKELTWQLNPEEKPQEGIKEPLTKEEEKEVLKKARELEKYL